MNFVKILKIQLGRVVENFKLNPLNLNFLKKDLFRNEKSPPLKVKFLKFWAAFRVTRFWKIASRYHALLLTIKILR
jgi:hypothetical protein